MATNGMEIKVGADVAGALTGLQALAQKVELTDNAFEKAFKNISDSVDKNVASAVADTQKLAKGITTLEQKFQALGGLKKFVPPEIPENFRRFSASVDNAGAAVSKLTPRVAGANTTLINFGRVVQDVQDAPFGIIGIANNIDPLLNSFQQLKASTGSSTLAFKALGSALIGPAGIAIAVSAITSLLAVYTQKKQQEAAALKASKDELKTFADVQKEVASNYSKEVTQVDLLVRVLGDENTKRKDKEIALKNLSKINPEYFSGLRIENGLVLGLAEAYRKYVERIDKVIQAKAIEKQIEGINDKLLTQGKNSEVVNVFNQALVKTLKEQKKAGDDIGKTNELISKLTEKNKANGQAELNLLLQKNILLNKLAQITQQIGVEDKTNSKEKKEAAEKETVLLKDQLISRSRLSEVTAKDLATLKELGNTLQGIQQKANEIRGAGGLAGGLSNPNDQSQKSTLKILDPSALNDLQNVDKLNEKLLNTKDLINNGINGGIDTFFNAIANNQDPFKALAQSAARLVTELGAAVVKALLLKVITKAISGGIGGGADRALAGFGKGLSGGGAVRGDIMRLAMFR